MNPFRVAAVIVVGFAAPALAVPPGFNFQGRLTDANGVNRDGAFSVKFTLFDAASGGNSLWVKTFPAVNVHGGNFQVVLGDPPDAGSANANIFGALSSDSRYLEVEVLSGPGVAGPEPPLVPRQQLVSNPFAIRAGTVDNASALVSTGIITFTTAGAERMRVDANGNVGIGTSNPANRLDVAGGGLILRGSMTVAGTAAPPVSAAGQGALYFDSGSNQFMVSQNAGAYAPLGAGGGAAGGVLRRTAFTTNGSWTPPPGVTTAWVSMVGGGGGGGSGYSLACGGGGGAGAALVRFQVFLGAAGTPYPALPSFNGTVTVIIGQGGAGGVDRGAAGNGGATKILDGSGNSLAVPGGFGGSLGTLLGCNQGGASGGGAVGGCANAGTAGSSGIGGGAGGGGGSGGIGVGATYGGNGGPSPFYSGGLSGYEAGGGGGASVFGAGGLSGVNGAYPGFAPASGYGGGGGGGCTFYAAYGPDTGGAGAPGLVVIEY